MIGALAAALGTMAARLSLGKKNLLPFEQDHRRIIRRTNALRRRLLALTEEDAAAFEPLSRAYSLDKNAPDYAEVMTAATLGAAQTPFAMMQRCCELIELLEELREKCSALLLSDVGCAAAAGRAALECAAMNVFVNTRLLPENGRARELAAEAETMLREYIPRAQALADSVTDLLRKPK